MATVRIPSLLRALCEGAEIVDVEGGTLSEVFNALDARCSGIRDRLLDGPRIRQGIAVWVDGDEADGPSTPVAPGSEVQILPAIAGG